MNLKDQLNQINGRFSYVDTRMMDNVEYYRFVSGLVWKCLVHPDDVKIMFYIFDQHISKGLIELDDSLVRSFQDIQKSLIQSGTYKEIMACMDRPYEDLNLTDL